MVLGTSAKDDERLPKGAAPSGQFWTASDYIVRYRKRNIFLLLGELIPARQRFGRKAGKRR
jgi:hypothetical protein